MIVPSSDLQYRKVSDKNSETKSSTCRRLASTLSDVLSPHSAGSRKVAFTLAEVLITLGIIGVVAAMTLPALVQKQNNKKLQTGLKTAYSLLSQALDKMYADGLSTISSDYFSSSLNFVPLYMKYFESPINCGMKATLIEDDNPYCLSRHSNEGVVGVNDAETSYKTYNRSRNINITYLDDRSFYIKNGMLFLFEKSVSSRRLMVSVDVNGKPKGPNVWGQDLFTFEILPIGDRGFIIPMGADETKYNQSNESTYCSKISNNAMNGIGCTARALSENDYFKNLPD